MLKCQTMPILRYNELMKKTVGDLINEQVKQQRDIERTVVLPKDWVSPMAKVFETMQEISGRLEEPMRAAAKVAETVQPQIDAIQKMNLPDISNLVNTPIIPDSIRGENGDFFIPQPIRPIQEVRIVNPEILGRADTQEEPKQNAVSYPLPPRAVWESLTIQFVDGHIVKVSYVGMESEKFDFKDMGFINLKTMKPDKKWELLRAIADHRGALTVSGWNRQFGRNVKYELNEGLKRFFKMKDKPIPHYTKQRGYRPLFTLKSDQ